MSDTMTYPHLSHLPASAEQALQQLASDILDQYDLGNKSSARAMLNNVLHKRKAYVTMWLMIHAQQRKQTGDAYSLICSVTT